ncbi:unnamed protein product [Brachionus calyciflorus]|uniref:C2H2-type domain-containing protein n=1 Tax=Brachionus calyciflorus TaxID=104777 RepID=A0A813Y906_9BILA|nr:unnamed protein product [Brachionus calyciflorus]
MQITERRNDEVKTKNYRVKNSEWHCNVCDVFCNSQAQFEVHLMSQKHKLAENNVFSANENSYTLNTDDQVNKNFDENNNLEEKPKIDIHDFALSEKYKVNAQKYLIPESKRVGKFEKFGFYCEKCNAYMTGQIQLVMHVKGAKHQFYCPNEIPDYKPSKIYSPGYKPSRFNQRPSLPEPIGCPKSLQTNIPKKNTQMPCSTPVKTDQVNGTYMEYYIKNQNLIQNQYYPRYLATNYSNSFSSSYQTPVFNQYNQSQIYNTSPTNQTTNQPNGSYFGPFINNTSPPNLIPNYQITQSFRFIPNQSSLIMVKNDNLSDSNSKPSSYSSDNCLNRSFEKNYPAYNGFDSPVFNLQANYSNGMPNHQSPQLYYQQPKNHGFMYNSAENSTVSTSPQVNLAYYQNYSIIS